MMCYTVALQVDCCCCPAAAHAVLFCRFVLHFTDCVRRNRALPLTLQQVNDQLLHWKQRGGLPGKGALPTRELRRSVATNGSGVCMLSPEQLSQAPVSLDV
jgi:hypothetical protein